MFATRWNVGPVLLLGVVAGLAAGQPSTKEGRVGERRPAGPVEVRGVMRAVDTARSSLTITLPGRGREAAADEKTYTLAKDAEVLLDNGRGSRFVLREGKLGDLAPGALVTLTLADEGKAVERVVAEGPTLQGKVKAIDPGKGTITLALPPRGRDEEAQEKTFTLDKKAEIGVDDGRGRRYSLKEAKLVDVPAGSLATLKLSVDQKAVQSLVATGPVVVGIVKAVDVKGRTVTVQQGRGREGEAEEKTYPLARDAVVVLGSGRERRFLRAGRLADLHPGALADLKLSLDQKSVVLLRAAGPTVYGMLKAVDAGKGTVTVLVGAGRGSDGEEKTYTLAKKGKVYQGGKAVRLADLKAKEVGVSVRLSLDQKQAESITVVGEGRR